MASIPLPALHINPPADPSEGMQRILAIKNTMDQSAQQKALMPGQIQQQKQTLEAGQQENAMRSQQMKNIQAQTAAMHEWDGKSLDELPGLMLKHGATADVVMSTRQGLVKYQQELAAKDKAQLENEAKSNDLLLGHIDAIKGATDPQQRQQVAQSQAAQILSAGLHKHLDPQSQQMIQAIAQGQMVPNDDQLTLFEKGLTGHTAQIEQTLKAAETGKNTEQGNQAHAQSMKLAREMEFYQRKGLAPGVPLDVQEAADWLDKNPGKGAADYMKMKATLVPAFNFNLQNTGTGAGGNAGDTAQRFGMSPVAFDQAAEKYFQTGQLPPAGRGGPALATNKAIMNRAAELHPDGSLAGNAAIFAANKRSLEGLQKQFDQVTAFENTAGKNLDVFLSQAQKVVDSGNPLINKPLRSISGAMGGTDQAAFNAARTTALTEIAKVLNSSNASGVLSDSARHEVEGLIGKDATLQQIVSAANILKKDMANRHDSYQDQINDIQGRLRGKTQGTSIEQQKQKTDGVIYARDPQGKLHSAPAGSTLPDGWILEKRK